jgi:hypothetical protein
VSQGITSDPDCRRGPQYAGAGFFIKREMQCAKFLDRGIRLAEKHDARAQSRDRDHVSLE